MSESNSSTPFSSDKPAKPYPDFPLTPHPTGRWCKKIRGRIHYFGPLDNPDGALAKYLEQKDALHAGRKPRVDADGVTVKEIVNSFLTHKQGLLDDGEISAHTWAKYRDASDEVIAAFGKSRTAADLDSDDFASLRKRMAKKWGVYRLADMIQHIRSIFKHGHDARLLPLPLHFGPGFKRPSKKTQRLHRAEQGANLFTAEEVRRLIDEAGPSMRAMVLLGINCGFGNADCGTLPSSAVDLDEGMIDFPRPKTGIARRCSLWPETVAALRVTLAKRPQPKHEQDAALFFLTMFGGSWQASEVDRPVAKETAKLLRTLRINRRKGLGFYTLRHTFRTVADESRDQPAVDFIMGHEVPHMSAVYRETISDERLRTVADYVRNWLFNEPTAQKEAFTWSLPTRPTTEDELLSALDKDGEEIRLMHGHSKANYKQMVQLKRLLAKGWREPYYYRGDIWLSNPLSKASHRSSNNGPLGKAIRITKTGRILRGW